MIPGMKPADTAAARELLARTSELLPASTTELMAVLAEYRRALAALAVPTTRDDTRTGSAGKPRPAGA
jgi:hypothetical protein